MTVQDIIAEARADAAANGGNLDWNKVREQIIEAHFDGPANERAALLQVRHLLLNTVEESLSPADLEKFRIARQQEYCMLLTKECIVGDGDVHPDLLDTVTLREVEAGRMAPDNELRLLAILGPAGLDAAKKSSTVAAAIQPAAQPRKVSSWRRLFFRAAA